MDYLPIFIDVRARACLVAGGGQVAARKVELLRSAGGVVRVVAPEVCPELQALAADGALRLEHRAYESGDLDGAWLVIAATDSVQINARVAADANARSIPVNVVDSPALCTFVMPAIVDRSPVLVAVSTAGASPVLARLTRARLEAALPQRLGRLAAFAARLRTTVKERIAEPAQRRAFWELILDGEVGALVLDGLEDAAALAFERLLAHPDARVSRGHATLIAAGDGDIERLSLRAVRALGSADVLLHESDALVVLTALGRRDAERVDVGRLGGRAAQDWSRDALVQAVIANVAAGKRICVVRLGELTYEEESRELRKMAVHPEVLRP